MKTFHEDSRRTVTEVFDVISTFIDSKRYCSKFYSDQYRESKKNLWPQKQAAFNRIIRSIQSMRLMSVTRCYKTVVKLDSELRLLASDSGVHQKRKIHDLIDYSYSYLAGDFKKKKYSERNLILTKEIVRIDRIKSIAI